jgi:hypothetical protein
MMLCTSQVSMPSRSQSRLAWAQGQNQPVARIQGLDLRVNLVPVDWGGQTPAAQEAFGVLSGIDALDLSG